MKKPFQIAALAALSLSLSCAQQGHAVTLVRDGKPVAKIYLAAVAPVAGAPVVAPVAPVAGAAPVAAPPLVAPVELQTAATELNYHLKKMSGAELEVVVAPDAKSVKGPAVVMGELARAMGATTKKPTFGREGVRILSKGDTLLIGGESDRSSLLGTYSVLEKLGCDWVMPGEIGEIIPQKKTVEIGALDEAQAPSFAGRSLWYRGGFSIYTQADIDRFGQWSARQKGGGGVNKIIGASAGHYWDCLLYTSPSPRDS